MPSDTPNTIRVGEIQRREIASDRANLAVTVEGMSLFSGQEALHKAREVAQLVKALTEYGLPSTDIFLQSIYTENYSGTITRASHVRYRLRIHCADLSRLADLLGIVAAQKNTTLHSIEWGYAEDDSRKDQWLQECIARVNAKAAQIAAGLGVRLLGIHAFSEQYLDQERTSQTTFAADLAAMRRSGKQVTSEELGLEISHTKEVQVSVDVEYVVSGFEEKGT